MKALALWKEFDNPTDNHTDTKPACNISFTSEAEKKMEQVIKKLGKMNKDGVPGDRLGVHVKFYLQEIENKYMWIFFSHWVGYEINP